MDKPNRNRIRIGQRIQGKQQSLKPEDHWSCIAHLNAEDMLKSAVIEDTKFKNTESD